MTKYGSPIEANAIIIQHYLGETERIEIRELDSDFDEVKLTKEIEKEYTDPRIFFCKIPHAHCLPCERDLVSS